MRSSSNVSAVTGAVGRYHYLPVRHVQRVERVKEALLRLFLANQELDVVQQQYVLIAEAVSNSSVVPSRIALMYALVNSSVVE